MIFLYVCILVCSFQIHHQDNGRRSANGKGYFRVQGVITSWRRLEKKGNNVRERESQGNWELANGKLWLISYSVFHKYSIWALANKSQYSEWTDENRKLLNKFCSIIKLVGPMIFLTFLKVWLKEGSSHHLYHLITHLRFNDKTQGYALSLRQFMTFLWGNPWTLQKTSPSLDDWLCFYCNIQLLIL